MIVVHGRTLEMLKQPLPRQEGRELGATQHHHVTPSVKLLDEVIQLDSAHCTRVTPWALHVMSISQINGSVTRDGTTTGVTVSATLSSSSTTVGNGEGSRYLNPLRVKPPRSASGPTNRSMMTNAKSPLTGPQRRSSRLR